MTTISEFRALFWARKVFVFLFVLAISYLIFKLFENIIIFIILIILSFAYQFYKLKSVWKIIVSEKGITKISFLTNKKEFFSFSEIENVGLTHVEGKKGAYGTLGKISEGFYESNVILKNKKTILITPDHFENYRELVKSISENFTKFNA